MVAPDSAPRSSTRLGRWLLFAAAALALAAGLALREPIADPEREPIGLSAGLIWAFTLAALLAGLGAGLLLGRAGGRGARRGLLIGAALALLVGASGAAVGQLAGPQPMIAGCAQLPRATVGTLEGWATLDGATIDFVDATPADSVTIVGVLGELENVPFEDHGLEGVDGAPTRRCSVLVDGDAALAAMPALVELGGRVGDVGLQLPVWRGELEWWKSADSQLVAARVAVGGHPADAWAGQGSRGEGLRGRIDGTFRALAESAR